MRHDQRLDCSKPEPCNVMCLDLSFTGSMVASVVFQPAPFGVDGGAGNTVPPTGAAAEAYAGTPRGRIYDFLYRIPLQQTPLRPSGPLRCLSLPYQKSTKTHSSGISESIIVPGQNVILMKTPWGVGGGPT